MALPDYNPYEDFYKESMADLVETWVDGSSAKPFALDVHAATIGHVSFKEDQGKEIVESNEPKMLSIYEVTDDLLWEQIAVRKKLLDSMTWTSLLGSGKIQQELNMLQLRYESMLCATMIPENEVTAKELETQIALRIALAQKPMYVAHKAKYLAEARRLQDHLYETEAYKLEHPGFTIDPSDPDLYKLEPLGGSQPVVYLVLPPLFNPIYVRPYRDSYVHKGCGEMTMMAEELADTYARNPKFYSSTWCCKCKAHFAVAGFFWVQDGIATDIEVGT